MSSVRCQVSGFRRQVSGDPCHISHVMWYEDEQGYQSCPPNILDSEENVSQEVAPTTVDAKYICDVTLACYDAKLEGSCEQFSGRVPRLLGWWGRGHPHTQHIEWCHHCLFHHHPPWPGNIEAPLRPAPHPAGPAQHLRPSQEKLRPTTSCLTPSSISWCSSSLPSPSFGCSSCGILHPGGTLHPGPQ